MLDSASQIGGNAGDVLRYFAGQVVPLENVGRAVSTTSFWTGVALGLVVGIVAGAQMVAG